MKKLILFMVATIAASISTAQNSNIELLRNKSFKVIKAGKSWQEFNDAYLIFKNIDTFFVKKGEQFNYCTFWDGAEEVILNTDVADDKKGLTYSSTSYVLVKKLKKNQIIFLSRVPDSLIIEEVKKIKIPPNNKIIGF